MPADAAHPETWNFLTLVVLPDVALTQESPCSPRNEHWVAHETFSAGRGRAGRPWKTS